jgi:hypothetical protein
MVFPYGVGTCPTVGQPCPLRCMNQDNPYVSSPNHLDLTYEHTKIYLSVVSNPDSWRAR